MKIHEVHIFMFHQRLVYILTIVGPKLLLDLIVEFGELVKEFDELFFANGEAAEVSSGSHDEEMSLVKAYVESTNYSALSKLPPQELFLVDLIADIISSLLNE